MFNGNLTLDEWIDVYVPLIQAAGRQRGVDAEFERRRDDIKDEFEFRGFPSDALTQVQAILTNYQLGDTTP